MTGHWGSYYFNTPLQTHWRGHCTWNGRSIYPNDLGLRIFLRLRITHGETANAVRYHKQFVWHFGAWEKNLTWLKATISSLALSHPAISTIDVTFGSIRHYPYNRAIGTLGAKCLFWCNFQGPLCSIPEVLIEENFCCRWSASVGFWEFSLNCSLSPFPCYTDVSIVHISLPCSSFADKVTLWNWWCLNSFLSTCSLIFVCFVC